MQVDSRWAQPVVSDLASLPYDGNHQTHNIEQEISVVDIRPPPPLITTTFFPPQRVEPVDMPRVQQQTANRNKIGYIRSAITDEQQKNASLTPIKRVQHPADRSSFIFFLKRLSTLCFMLFISLPCVILITLILPVSWLIRTLIRFTCRYRCTVTPCTCSYLTASDLFWLLKSNTSLNRNKNDETTKLTAYTNAPIAAAIFFLEGNVILKVFLSILLF
jgi:hypothetical protein